MNLEELILVSVDDHVVEPPDMFAGRLRARFRDEAPRVETLKDGMEVWRYGDQLVPNIGLNAVAGRPPEEYGMEPTRFDEIRPGCFDVAERVKDMSANGVLGSLNFPSLPGWCGQLFARDAGRDEARASAMVRAYNDWHLEGWCGAFPDRFIPLAIPMLWSPVLMADEVRRVADLGCHAVTFSENPAALGYPSFHSDHWDPFWAACQETETVVCLHIGSSSTMPITADDAPIDVLITLSPMNIVSAAADLVWSPVLRRFPRIRIALSEGGIGWIPYFLERIDYVYTHHRAWTHQDFAGRLPSEVFKEHFVTCFIDDAFGVKNHDELNVDMITWECDYPHSDSTWPTAPEAAMRYLSGLPDGDIDKITHLNAMRIFQFDPFALRSRASSTVASLRAEVAGRDVSSAGRGTAGAVRARTGAALRALEAI
jgi:predicted TIM-barrel fold metal-dependent hydrolase